MKSATLGRFVDLYYPVIDFRLLVGPTYLELRGRYLAPSIYDYVQDKFLFLGAKHNKLTTVVTEKLMIRYRA